MVKSDVSRGKDNSPAYMYGGIHMVSETLIYSVNVMSDGQVIIPKDVLDVLGISIGDRVIFVVEDGNVRLINSAKYEKEVVQSQMQGEAGK